MHIKPTGFTIASTQDGYLTRGSSISALGINVSSGHFAWGYSPSSGYGEQPILIIVEDGVVKYNVGWYGLGVSNGMLVGGVGSSGYGGAWRLYQYE